MYSIYDYYGIKNDLDNRYTAAKQQGTSPVEKNNTPFLSMLTEPTPTSTIANTGTAELPSSGTLYGMSSDRSEGSPDRSSIYGDVDWSQYPSPSGFGWAADNIMAPGFTWAMGLAGGAIGGPPGAVAGKFIGNSLFDYLKHERALEEGKTTEPFDWSKNIWKNALKGGASFIPTPNLKDPLMNMLAGQLAGKAKSELADYAAKKTSNPFKSVIDWVKGLAGGEDQTDQGPYNPTTGIGDPIGGQGYMGPFNIGANPDVFGTNSGGGGATFGGGPNDVPSDWSGYDWGDY